MVGYQKNDVTPHKKIIAGCVSGVFTRFVTQPVDVVKLRTQLQKRNPRKMHRSLWYPTMKRMMREEGVPGFFAGHMLGQVHSIMSVSSQFYFFELATRFAYSLQPNTKVPPHIKFLCGIFAGCCSTTLVLPIEVIRVRQMLAKEQYGGFLSGARLVYRSGGFFAFYEGLSASLIQMGPAVGISFGTFSYLQPLLLKLHHKEWHSPTNKYSPSQVLIASTVAGSIAGFLSKTATYPFDLAKRRLQIAKEGLRGLYRGWCITMFKAQLTSIMAFTSYEMICFMLREMDI